MMFKRDAPRTVKAIFVLLLVFLSVGLVALYYKEKLTSGEIVLKEISIDSKAALMLNSMHQTSTRNGIKEWTLDASSAKLLKDKNRAVMADVNVVFFMENGGKVNLSSARGTLDTTTHDMTFSDKVVVTHGAYTLETDELHYDKKRHILYSTVHIRIMDKESLLEADAMETDLNRSTTRLKGNVRGRFSETFDFFSGMDGNS
ncbi:MAG: LPS export ABC transporter periplasmic protein LptC [Desulfobacterium sp.]|nr:LPS export ABC transporter periplasmic protein LptC [Desulfobacterium sp.]